MAKRMDFSVVGLPHYTVWHLYEPSVDDIRHMEEMEQERKNREREEIERAERMKKIKEDFNDPNSQWDKDKADIEGITQKDEEAKKQLEQDRESERKQDTAGQQVKGTSEKTETKGIKKDSRDADAGSVKEALDPEGGKEAPNSKDEKKGAAPIDALEANGPKEEPKAAKAKAAAD